jgi:hypothetical protein
MTTSSVVDSIIFKILKKRQKDEHKHLDELNKALRDEKNSKLLTKNDTKIYGSFLHYLTQTAQKDDE